MRSYETLRISGDFGGIEVAGRARRTAVGQADTACRMCAYVPGYAPKFGPRANRALSAALPRHNTCGIGAFNEWLRNIVNELDAREGAPGAGMVHWPVNLATSFESDELAVNLPLCECYGLNRHLLWPATDRDVASDGGRSLRNR